MTTAAHANDFAFDYTRGNEAKAAKPAAGFLSRAFDRFVARRQAAAIAQIAMFDPRLAREIRAAQDRAEWADSE
jgi:hypothetical protein